MQLVGVLGKIVVGVPRVVEHGDVHVSYVERVKMFCAGKPVGHFGIFQSKRWQIVRGQMEGAYIMGVALIEVMVADS